MLHLRQHRQWDLEMGIVDSIGHWGLWIQEKRSIGEKRKKRTSKDRIRWTWSVKKEIGWCSFQWFSIPIFVCARFMFCLLMLRHSDFSSSSPSQSLLHSVNKCCFDDKTAVPSRFPPFFFLSLENIQVIISMISNNKIVLLWLELRRNIPSVFLLWFYVYFFQIKLCMALKTAFLPLSLSCLNKRFNV